MTKIAEYKERPFKYYKGDKDNYEMIEIYLYMGEKYYTTAVANVRLLMAGHKTFPCGNGDDFKLDPCVYYHLLVFLKEHREKLKSGYEVKTKAAWYASGLPTFEDFFNVGDTVDDELVQDMVNDVPPVLLWDSCTQIGEAYNSEYDEDRQCHRDTYITFHKVGDGRWTFDGYCFKGENKNRLTRPSQLDTMIAEAKKASDDEWQERYRRYGI